MKEEDRNTPDARSSGRVYVLRIWHEGAVTERAWRASLREGADGERRYFASVDDCIEHLYAEFLRH